MNPSEIIARASEEGAVLALSSSGSISAKGDQSAIDPWLQVIKQRKAAIIAELHLERRRAKLLAMLRDNPASTTPSRWWMRLLNRLPMAAAQGLSFMDYCAQ